MHHGNGNSVLGIVQFGAVGLLAAGFILLACLLASLIPSAQAQHVPGHAVTAYAARVAGDQKKTRFVLDLERQLAYTVVVLSDPFRVVIDMPEVAFDLPPEIGQQGRGLVTRYRYGRLDHGKSRVVIDVTGPVLIDKTFMVEPEAGGPARLVLDLIATDEKTYALIRDRLKPRDRAPEAVADAPRQDLSRTDRTEARNVPPPADRMVRPPLPRPRPALQQVSAVTPPADEAAQVHRAPPASAAQTVAAIAPAVSGSVTDQPATGAPADKAPAAPLADAVVEPSASFAGPVLGGSQVKPRPPVQKKGKPVVVIDPGHGGIDPGAIGSTGSREKDIVLGFAKVLRDTLAATGRYDVRMTRSDDRFIPLAKRVAFARSNQAELFISIHADSLKRGVAHGATVYTLSEQASDKEAAETAASENKADLVGGIIDDGDSGELADILADLVHLETRNHSLYFAKTLVGTLDGKTPLNTKPHRTAGFRVLRAPDVPSVLLELGYLSSREDEQRMASDAWRRKVAKAMVSAVDRFFGTAVARRQ